MKFTSLLVSENAFLAGVGNPKGFLSCFDKLKCDCEVFDLRLRALEKLKRAALGQCPIIPANLCTWPMLKGDQ